jgi:hypothetical protein
MARITVPKPPRSAYNPGRPAGTLLQAQLTHLEWAVRAAGERTGGKRDAPSGITEGQVAERIEQLMAELHQKTVGRAPIIHPTSGTRKRSRTPAKRRMGAGKRKRSHQRKTG